VLLFLPLGPLTEMALSAARWVIAIAVVMMGLSVIYRFGPNRRGHRPSWFTPGAAVAVLIWAAGSWGFSYYLANFGQYNEIYGTLGAFIALLMWFYLSAYVVLLGGLLNAELETARAVAKGATGANTSARPDPLAAERTAPVTTAAV